MDLPHRKNLLAAGVFALGCSEVQTFSSYELHDFYDTSVKSIIFPLHQNLFIINLIEMSEKRIKRIIAPRYEKQVIFNASLCRKM
jgi:hypothetical protein